MHDDKYIKIIGDVVQQKVTEALSGGTDKERALVLARVPYICSEIEDINKTLKAIEEKLVYVPLMQRLVFGLVTMVLIAVTTALIGLVVLK